MLSHPVAVLLSFAVFTRSKEVTLQNLPANLPIVANSFTLVAGVVMILVTWRMKKHTGAEISAAVPRRPGSKLRYITRMQCNIPLIKGSPLRMATLKRLSLLLTIGTVPQGAGTRTMVTLGIIVMTLALTACF